jgi:hypothetical protein
MLILEVILDGEGCWPDLAEKTVINLGNESKPIQVAALPKGLVSGKPSVSIRLDLPDGNVVIAETSLALFLSAAETFRLHYGDPREESPGGQRWDDES